MLLRRPAVEYVLLKFDVTCGFCLIFAFGEPNCTNFGLVVFNSTGKV